MLLLEDGEEGEEVRIFPNEDVWHDNGEDRTPRVILEVFRRRTSIQRSVADLKLI